ncbi:MAG: hypothetical protein JO304_08160 [Solirubrobacterales bacterium]|nr:hypothetical protein [Solirubrobacterales bacterium]
MLERSRNARQGGPLVAARSADAAGTSGRPLGQLDGVGVSGELFAVLLPCV